MNLNFIGKPGDSVKLKLTGIDILTLATKTPSAIETFLAGQLPEKEYNATIVSINMKWANSEPVYDVKFQVVIGETTGEIDRTFSATNVSQTDVVPSDTSNDVNSINCIPTALQLPLPEDNLLFNVGEDLPANKIPADVIKAKGVIYTRYMVGVLSSVSSFLVADLSETQSVMSMIGEAGKVKFGVVISTDETKNIKNWINEIAQATLNLKLSAVFCIYHGSDAKLRTLRVEIAKQSSARLILVASPETKEDVLKPMLIELNVADDRNNLFYYGTPIAKPQTFQWEFKEVGDGFQISPTAREFDAISHCQMAYIGLWEMVASYLGLPKFRFQNTDMWRRCYGIFVRCFDWNTGRLLPRAYAYGHYAQELGDLSFQKLKEAYKRGIEEKKIKTIATRERVRHFIRASNDKPVRSTNMRRNYSQFIDIPRYPTTQQAILGYLHSRLPGRLLNHRDWSIVKQLTNGLILNTAPWLTREGVQQFGNDQDIKVALQQLFTATNPS